eukprot:TRINITY_DN32050_c0_g1_i1.p2 TRINITY_DN32050_c0_g1~~TRINITY_DN32050_c0_g1_i1.p2  ORF type:complete len:113 (-),score=11.48 TRINITY_DN32050_c0_g1_i1:391-729(-)
MHFWQGGHFIKDDKPQGNQVFCLMSEYIPEFVEAMRACIVETGESKFFSTNLTAEDPAEMIARGNLVLSFFCTTTVLAMALLRAHTLSVVILPSCVRRTRASSAPAVCWLEP